MCIICVEFNKHKDFQDTERMIEAARRESGYISEAHLQQVELRLKGMQSSGDIEDLDTETKD
ncbi:MAG: hypothetical protein HRU19_20220 [Pseudobacteriovorax sp.]|nr:hypothetical protein [Pseudobacteriovorax sp.]